jgi:osmotically inducible protein OsmC
MKPLYTAVATTRHGGRNGGHGETSDGKVAHDFSMPTELGGPGGAGTNPEQLVALGYSACFGSALAFVAGQDKLVLPAETAVTVKVMMGRNDAGGFAFEFLVEVSLPNLPSDQANALIARAHRVCPYSNAFRDGAPTTAVLAAD